MASRTARFVEFVSLPVYPSDTSTSPFAVAGAVLVLSPDAALPVVGLVCKDQVALCVKRLDAIDNRVEDICGAVVALKKNA